MNIKKITAYAAAFMLSIGVLTVVPGEVGLSENAAITVSAAKSSDFVIKTDSEGKKYVESYTGKGGDIRIPDGVDYIGEEAFNGNENITGISISKSCTELKNYSFANCKTLKSVVFEGNIKICDDVFAQCYNLEKVTIKGSIIDYIGVSAFSGCRSLKTVKISKNKYNFYIGMLAFNDCYSLTSVNIPSKCTKIGLCTFENCFNLKNLTIPAKTELEVESVGYVYVILNDPVKEDLIYDGFVADGKKSGYVPIYDDKGYTTGEYKKITPVQLTLTVTKGSPAEKYAKENGIKYKYAESKK